MTNIEVKSYCVKSIDYGEDGGIQLFTICVVVVGGKYRQEWRFTAGTSRRNAMKKIRRGIPVFKRGLNFFANMKPVAE